MHSKGKLSKEDSGIIKGSTTYLFCVIININIRAIDGMECRHLTNNKVEVMPGFHKVSVEYILISYTVKFFTSIDLLFNVEAGHQYKIKEKDSLLAVIDTTSGVVVANHPINQYTQYTTFSLNSF